MKGENSIPAVVVPHLRGMEAIGETFGVSRRTVREWAANGAPIRLVGRKYQASYPELWRWVEERGKHQKPVNCAHRDPEGCLAYASRSGPENEWYVVIPCMETTNVLPRQERV